MLEQARDQVITSALELAREALGMEAAHFGTFLAGVQEIQEVSGRSVQFGLEPGLQIPLEETFCRRMIAGRIPNIVADVTREPGVADLPSVVGGTIGAYVGVPVNASDGTAFGSLCCLSSRADPALKDRDITFMRLLGQLVGDRLQRQDLEWRERERLEELVALRTAELELAQTETAIRLSRAVEYRDDDTGNHIDRVGIMSELLARAAGAEATFCHLMRLAAPLHDIGKVAAPDRVLLKQGALTEQERLVIQAHPEIGHQMLADSSSDLLQLAASIARTHHERLDGGGYSQHLREQEIPLEGRIVAIADVFDALTHDRVYRAAMPVSDAVRIMREDAGHFDPELLDLFLTVVVPGLPFELPIT